MEFNVYDYRFRKIREELNRNGEGHEIFTVKDAIDRIHEKVDCISNAVSTGNEDRIGAACYRIDSDDIADLVLCAAHLMCLGDIPDEDVDRAIVENLDHGYYDADKPTKKKPSANSSRKIEEDEMSELTKAFAAILDIFRAPDDNKGGNNNA